MPAEKRLEGTDVKGDPKWTVVRGTGAK